MPVTRRLPDADSEQLLELVQQICDAELRPAVDAAEAAGRFPADVYRTLGQTGLLGLPYPEEYGGGSLSYEVYLQVLEELATAWLAVGIGVSVHTLSCFPLANFGTDEQRSQWLPPMLAGEQLGAYALSEPQSGSDAASLATTAVVDGDDYVVTGTKAWITHGSVADVVALMVRTGEAGPAGISCLFAATDTPGLAVQRPERKMGAATSPTTPIVLDAARIPRTRLIGAEGEGFKIALAALDAGRLGIAACAVGLAQAALDLAVEYAGQREQFGRPIGSFQGLQFLLADMATQVAAARALYLDAARLRDSGKPFSAAAAMAKLFATDTAMRVTTDTVQVLGGYGYVSDFPAERYFREAKVLQIVEGTNQIQRMVIGRHLLGT